MAHICDSWASRLMRPLGLSRLLRNFPICSILVKRYAPLRLDHHVLPPHAREHFTVS
jgi:hypothetical protein